MPTASNPGPLTTGVRKVERWIWVGLLLTFLLLLLAALLASLKARSVRSRNLPVYGTVAEFTLTNQAGQPVSLSALRGHVWVADIIFTRCAGPCLAMSKQMKALQEELPSGSTARLVSLTTDPEYDQPPVLAAYGQKFGADTNRWLFLTGTKAQIAAVAVDSLKLSAVEIKPEERKNPQDLFIHSTIFVVVDAQGRLRGVFDTQSEGEDPKAARARILGTVRKLERERQS
jgi:cytochrome oxidase Cu insertion factor (SCO1/SenC/PrrC family)